MGIFGNASARELSDINHTFDFWKIAFKNGTDSNGFHDKEMSIVDMMAQDSDVTRMKEIITAYKEASSDVVANEIINGVTFYYDGFILTDEIVEQLEGFSLSADEDTYSVYLDDGKLVIY